LPTDAELLAAFLSRRDETAFAEIVRRHGPMVLGVCRRGLHSDADAEDAFQATFIVLDRRDIRPGNRVAGSTSGRRRYTSPRLLF
jgi:DNA-directed RNA polymerase specialized sigma24 family protein